MPERVEDIEMIPNNKDATHAPIDLQLLQKLNETISSVKKECSNSLLPFLCQIEGVTANARRKILKDGSHVDGIVKEAIKINAVSNVAEEVEEDSEKGNCSDIMDDESETRNCSDMVDEESETENCFDMFD